MTVEKISNSPLSLMIKNSELNNSFKVKIVAVLCLCKLAIQLAATEVKCMQTANENMKRVRIENDKQSREDDIKIRKLIHEYQIFSHLIESITPFAKKNL